MHLSRTQVIKTGINDNFNIIINANIILIMQILFKYEYFLSIHRYKILPKKYGGSERTNFFPLVTIRGVCNKGENPPYF